MTPPICYVPEENPKLKDTLRKMSNTIDFKHLCNLIDLKNNLLDKKNNINSELNTINNKKVKYNRLSYLTQNDLGFKYGIKKDDLHSMVLQANEDRKKISKILESISKELIMIESKLIKYKQILQVIKTKNIIDYKDCFLGYNITDRITTAILYDSIRNIIIKEVFICNTEDEMDIRTVYGNMIKLYDDKKFNYEQSKELEKCKNDINYFTNKYLQYGGRLLGKTTESIKYILEYKPTSFITTNCKVAEKFLENGYKIDKVETTPIYHTYYLILK